MSHYLSIDMDFWYHLYPYDWDNLTEKTVAYHYLNQVASLCHARGIPLNAMMNHQQMLPFVDDSGATDLINIDMHSDLADSDCFEFNCGTWISYCKMRRTGHYHWIHRDSIDEGECNPEKPIFCRNGRHRSHITDWRSVRHTQTSAAPPPETLISKSSCVGVGVVLSPDYCGRALEKVFHDWRKKWNVPYRKGLRNEHRGVPRSPK